MYYSTYLFLYNLIKYYKIWITLYHSYKTYKYINEKKKIIVKKLDDWLILDYVKLNM